ncbi:MAG: c-type cytochrome [Mariprofundus sp.]|nr:c-type cytochrome [Mariprofundus sp.]
MKTAVMKKTIWISHLMLAGILLNGCSDAANQQHAQAANSASKQITALQVAMNQADDARQAIITADNNQRLARQEAQNRQQAVQQAIAQASKETQQLRQDAENKARWATTTHHKAIASREALLQAAMQQADAKQQLLNAEQAVLDARHQFQMDQRDAELTANIQHEANKALSLVLEAEQLAALSMQQLTVKQSNPNQSDTAQAEATQVHAEKNVTAAHKIHHKKSITKHKTIAKKHRAKTASKITETVRNTTQTHRSLKLASLNSMQPESLKRGRDLAQKCLLCHNLQPSSKKKFGPDLFTVFNQPAGKAKGYRYSNTLAKATFSWTEDNLAEWICHSGDSIKQLTGRSSARTKMSNQRICGQDAKDVVAYLRTIQSSSSIAVNQATSGRSLQLAGAI